MSLYSLFLFAFIFADVNCLYIREDHDSWPVNLQAENFATAQLWESSANYELSAGQIPRQQTVVVVPNSGQIPVSRTAQYGYGTSTMGRSPTTVIVSPPVQYPSY